MRGFAILAECWDLTSHCYLLLDSFLYAIASFGHYTHCLFLENIIKYMVSCKPFDNSWRKKQYFSEFFPKSWEHRLRISAVNPSRTGSRDGDDFVSKPASPNKPFVARAAHSFLPGACSYNELYKQTQCDCFHEFDTTVVILVHSRLLCCSAEGQAWPSQIQIGSKKWKGTF